MRCEAYHLRLILRFYFLFFLLVLYSTWNNYVSLASHTSKWEVPRGKKTTTLYNSQWIFFRPSSRRENCKGTNKKKANRSRFHLDGCCFFPFSAFILENLLLLLHTCCRIVHLTQGEFVYRYLMLFRSDWN